MSERIDADMALILREVGGDVDDARVVYTNDFSSRGEQGRSRGPMGSGELAAAADSMCPFHYRVSVDVDPDGSRSARFPTRTEQPGGGRSYCWFQSYVLGRGALLTGVTAWRWTVLVPTSVELTTPCSYYENRYVASVGIEDKVNHLGVRFDGHERLVWTRGHQPPDEDVLDVIPLGTRIVGGERLQFTLGVDVAAGRSALAIRDDARGIAVSLAGPIVDLGKANAISVSSSGNHLDTDTDTSKFFKMADVRIAQTGRAKPSTTKRIDPSDPLAEPMVPPGRA
ncbi:MAG: hypothetical protein Q8O67_15430 [Deltaproteobacteria bacterium]|nr:hypothetical protein [Deltaproteobacteria bacterium]